MPHAIETISLTKKFRQNRSLFRSQKDKVVQAVDGVDLQVRKGELFGLVGPNRAGKTTLLKLLSTLILPTSGKASINGYDILREEEKVRASIGLVTGGERSFYWRLTGRQNLRFFATLYNLSRLEAKKRIDELLELLELKEQADVQFQQYSTGIKQRMAVARCLLNDPEVLFMDEPTKSLDPGAAHKLREFIKDELVGRKGKTILFVTHQMAEAEDICDRVAIMDDGKIKACGSMDELRRAVGLEGATLDEVFREVTRG